MMNVDVEKTQLFFLKHAIIKYLQFYVTCTNDFHISFIKDI